MSIDIIYDAVLNGNAKAAAAGVEAARALIDAA